METHSKTLKLLLLSFLSIICVATYAQSANQNAELMNTVRYTRVIQNHITDSRISAASELSSAILIDGIEAGKEIFGVMQSQPNRYFVSQKQLLELGNKFINDGYVQEGIAVFELTAQAFPTDWNIVEKMGAAYILIGNLAAAEQCFDKASDIKARHELKDTVFSKIQL